MFTECDSFDWDVGNLEKNWIKHKVFKSECEQIFFNIPLVLLEDDEHSIEEKRYVALSQTDAGRLLTVIFTIRKHKIRVISASDMSQKERRFYAK
ncbi:BrnT family toxin [Deltaproteobacteria bacterium TL4]